MFGLSAYGTFPFSGTFATAGSLELDKEPFQIPILDTLVDSVLGALQTSEVGQIAGVSAVLQNSIGVLQAVQVGQIQVTSQISKYAASITAVSQPK